MYGLGTDFSTLLEIIDGVKMDPEKKRFLKAFFGHPEGSDINLKDFELPSSNNNVSTGKILRLFPSECAYTYDNPADVLDLCSEDRNISLCASSLLDEEYQYSRRVSFSNSRNQPVSKSPLGQFSCIMSPGFGEDEYPSFEASERTSESGEK